MSQSSAVKWRYYQGFGLLFRSVFVLPELPECLDRLDIEVDVEIAAGKVGFDGGSSPERPYRRGFEHGTFFLDVYGQVKFSVSGGQRIVVQKLRDKEEDWGEMRLFLFGSVMAALLQQRGHVVLHGSAFEWQGGAVVITGDSGSGKSTTAAAMAQKGFRILTDDVCSVQMNDEGEGIVHPGLRRQKLWGDALGKLGISREGLTPVKREMDKFSYPLENTFGSTALPLKQIFVLRLGASDGVEFSVCSQRNSLQMLVKQSYRLELTKGMGIHSEYFTTVTRLAKKVPVSLLKKTRHSQTLDSITTAIFEVLSR